VPICAARASLSARSRSKAQHSRPAASVKPEDIAVFSRQLATMLAAGIPLVQSFEIVGNGNDKPAMQKSRFSTSRPMSKAAPSLHEALGKHPLHFDDLFVNLVEAGEQAGALETLLDKIATYKEKTEALKKKVKKALFYPTAVLAVAIIVTIILLIFVIPQFESLFKGFGADLPAFTQFVINMSRWLQDNGIFFAPWSAARVTLHVLQEALEGDARVARPRDAQVPIIGPILYKSAIARFARTLSTMFAAGVPLVEALESVAGATGNIVFENAVLKMRDEVATGQRLQRAMENTGLFPNMVIQMIAVGEEAGALDAMSGKVATFYEAEVDNAVDSMSSLLEPLIMAILGVLVGGLVIAMYLPIFKLGAVV
jgi:type IV pilus assembly protein PilC